MPVGGGWDLPPGAEPWSDFHWFGPSTKADLVLVILSHEPNWYTGHYVEKRMTPCPGEGCEECHRGTGGQIRYVFGVADRVTRRCGLIEFGRSNGLLIREWAERNAGLHGLMIDVTKHSKNVQSRTVVTEVREAPPAWIYTIDPPDVCLALFLTWQKGNFRMPREFAEEMSRRSLRRQPALG